MNPLPPARKPAISLVKSLKARSVYLCLRCLSLLCQIRWHWFLPRLGTLLGDIAYLLLARFRRVSLSNLHLAFSSRYSESEIRRICRSNFRLFAKSILEFLSSPYLTQEELHSRVELRGAEFLRRALEQGRGAIVLSAHFGNWEWMGARACADGLPLSVIARPHDDPATESLIGSIRRHNGMKVIPRQDARAALRALRNNRILAILADQHAGPSGIPIQFFGRACSTFPGIAALALRSGAPVIPGFAIRRPDDSHLVTFYPPLELLSAPDSKESVRLNTELCSKVIEDQVRQHPDHWMWFHNRWRS